jgi:hypothetical protein
MDTWLKRLPPEIRSKLTVREADPRKEVDRIHSEFVSTLTPQQRWLVAAGIPVMFTPQQQAILQKLDPYLEGLTPEQVRALAFYD